MTTIAEKLIKELKTKALTILQLSELTGIEEPKIRTTINRLKEKTIVQETGMFLDRYKIYKLSDKLFNASFIMRMIKNLDGVKAVILISTVDGAPISSILPEGSIESRYAAMTVAIFSLMERACKETNKGKFKFCHIEGEDGKLLIISLNKGLTLSISFDSTVVNDLMFTSYLKIIDLIGNSLSDLIQ